MGPTAHIVIGAAIGVIGTVAIEYAVLRVVLPRILPGIIRRGLRSYVDSRVRRDPLFAAAIAGASVVVNPLIDDVIPELTTRIVREALL